MTSWIGRKYQQNIELTKDISKIYSNLHINKKKWTSQQKNVFSRRLFPNEKIQIANKHEKMSNFVSPQENTK